jgi:hypothetical protein
MQHGIVIMCHDGIERRFYPRIFTYSADYPEKLVQLLRWLNPADNLPISRTFIATIRNQGLCPCPRCTVPLSEFEHTGTTSDQLKRQDLRRNPLQQQALVEQAHGIIFGGMRAITNEDVEALLKPESWTPVIVSIHTRSAAWRCTYWTRMFSPASLEWANLISSLRLWWISYTTSRLVFGSLSLCTSSESLTVRQHHDTYEQLIIH